MNADEMKQVIFRLPPAWVKRLDRVLSQQGYTSRQSWFMQQAEAYMADHAKRTRRVRQRRTKQVRLTRDDAGDTP